MVFYVFGLEPIAGGFEALDDLITARSDSEGQFAEQVFVAFFEFGLMPSAGGFEAFDDSITARSDSDGQFVEQVLVVFYVFGLVPIAGGFEAGDVALQRCNFFLEFLPSFASGLEVVFQASKSPTDIFFEVKRKAVNELR